jgi:hypothetical protein
MMESGGIHGRKTQRFNLTVQRFVKLCPGFASSRIPIIDLRGVRRRIKDLRHNRLHIEGMRFLPPPAQKIEASTALGATPFVPAEDPRRAG